MLRAVANVPGFLGSFTYANLPAAANCSGLTARATDIGIAPGMMLVSDGTRWKPEGGRGLLKHLGAGVSGVANTATIVLQTAALPAGLIKATDSIQFDIGGFTKSGTTDSLNYTIYAGTAGTTSDTAILNSANTGLAASAQSGDLLVNHKIISNTSVLRTGAIIGGSAYSQTSTSAAPSAVVITDLSANAMYFSFAIASSGATNTVGIQDGAIWWVAH